MQEANIIEIFSSVQGEGPYIGYRQLFIRFANCNLNCLYCDTQFKPQNNCKLEACPGSESFIEYKNPVTSEFLIKKIEEMNYFNHHSISLTGGEPLLNTKFINCFLSEFQNKKSDLNLKTYLETNGTLPDKLEEIIQNIDIISMDFKLESSCGTPTPWQAHKDFINVAHKHNKEIFAKIVITSKIAPDEVAKITDLVISLEQDIPITLQPVTSKNEKLVPTSSTLLSVQEALLRAIPNVRIVPQTHKYLNLL